MPMPRHDHIYATPAQESYLDKLWIEVFRYGTAKWSRGSRRLLKSDASREITMLLEAIEQGKRERVAACG